jgi:hypothetical protein
LPQKERKIPITIGTSAGKIQLLTFSLLLKFPKLVVVPPLRQAIRLASLNK